MNPARVKVVETGSTGLTGKGVPKEKSQEKTFRRPGQVEPDKANHGI